MIREHPYWWVSLSLNGFRYHVNVDVDNENFTKLKIWIKKEDADTSQTCQAYEPLQAKKQKIRMRSMVDLVASHCGVINQWQLILIFLQALNKGKPIYWIFSLKTFNMHPKHRVKFSDWLIKISCVLQTINAAFKTELERETIFMQFQHYGNHGRRTQEKRLFMPSINLFPGVFLTSTFLVANAI